MITKITTHIKDALSRLLFQYKNAINFQNLITATEGEQIQDLEDSIFSLIGRLDIDNQSGIQLDNIGDIVGQDRQGLTDEEYKIFLKAKAAVNVSEGDAERLISVWKLLMGANIVELREVFPAEVDLYTDTSIGDPDLESLAFQLIQDVAAGGVKVGFAAVFPVDAFGFFDSVDTKGFSDTGDPTSGGKLSYIIGQ
jgi:hypothetical protein